MTWQVYAGDELVLSVRDEPGPLTSTAPGGARVLHPFLTAAAHEAGHEAELRAILDGASDPEDFRARLTAAGYRVE